MIAPREAIRKNSAYTGKERYVGHRDKVRM